MTRNCVKVATVWLALVAVAVLLSSGGCSSTPITSEGLARALEPVLRELPQAMNAAFPEAGDGGTELPPIVVIDVDVDLGQLWGIFRLFAVTTKTEVDIVVVVPRAAKREARVPE